MADMFSSHGYVHHQPIYYYARVVAHYPWSSVRMRRISLAMIRGNTTGGNGRPGLVKQLEHRLLSSHSLLRTAIPNGGPWSFLIMR